MEQRPITPQFMVDEQPYFVDEILHTEKRNGIESARIKWIGLPNQDASWVPMSSLHPFEQQRVRRRHADSDAGGVTPSCVPAGMQASE